MSGGVEPFGSSSRSRPRIGLFIQGGAYAYQAGIIFGAHEECSARGFDLYAFSGGGLAIPEPRSYVYTVASPRDLDAAVMVPGTWGTAVDHPRSIELLDRFAEIPRCIIGVPYGGLPSVEVQNRAGVASITRHLIEVHGRRRLAFIAGPGPESEQRHAGFREAVQAAGIPEDPELFSAGYYTAESGSEAVERWFGGGERRCDAIVAANDWMAIGALERLRSLKIHVPDEVSLVGFDDIEQASFLSPPLTTIRQPPPLLGIQAIACVADLLQGKPRSDEHQWVPTLLQIRQSCGCFGAASSLRREARVSMLPNASSLAGARRELADALERAAQSLSRGLRADWAQHFADCFIAGVNGDDDGGFLEALTEVISVREQHGNIMAWHHVVARLRDAAFAHVAAGRWMLAEALLCRAHILIGEHAERLQGQRLMAREHVTTLLDAAAVEVRTSVDAGSLHAALAHHLPQLGVPSCYVTVGGGGPESQSEQALVYDSRNAHATAATARSQFRTGELIEPEHRPARRHSMVVHPLFVRDEALGFCCLEMGPRDGTVYRSVSDTISSAVKAIQLSEALVEEATKRERAEQARMAQELEIAARIQTGIVPRKFDVPSLEIAATMVPATEVGGDYFDVLPFEGGAWLGIGDVAGHGLHTGLVMLMIQSIVAAIVYENPDVPCVQAWRTANAVLTENVRERLGQDEHATLTLIRYTPKGEMTFAGAHEDLIVLRQASGECELVPTRGIWAGIRREPPAEALIESRCQLEPGDVLVLYTDGITEARNTDGELYGLDRLCSALLAARAEPAASIRDRVVRELGAWMAVQDDDFTLVVARYRG